MYTYDELWKALLAKGLYWVGGGDHRKASLYLDGRQIPIWTVVSHKRGDVPAGLRSRIARELKMPNADYLRRFVECEVSGEDYIAMLRESGVI